METHQIDEAKLNIDILELQQVVANYLTVRDKLDLLIESFFS